MTDDVAKKKCRQCSVDYLKDYFIQSSHNEQSSLCLICDKTLSTGDMKPSKLNEHLRKLLLFILLYVNVFMLHFSASTFASVGLALVRFTLTKEYGVLGNYVL